MIQDFSKYLPVLQKLGNARMSYCIFVDEDVKLNPSELCLSLPVSKNVLLVTDKYNKSNFLGGICTVIECSESELFDSVVHSETLITIVIGPIQLLTNGTTMTPLSNLFNEVHTNVVLNTKLFKCVKELEYHQAYIQNLIDSPDIVAVLPINMADALYVSNFFDTFKPWHILLVNKETKEAVQIIWDLREIVGYGYLSEEQFKLAMSCKNANDNSRLLYAKPNKYPKGFEQYIIDYIEI